ncbi:MAG TPA: hypothetical protein VF796_18625 [Humisphaera sp.]
MPAVRRPSPALPGWYDVPMLGDIRSPRLLYLKAVLFVLCGLLAGGLILLETPSLKVAGLLAVTVWAFCRAYYFAFYVVAHYADPGYRFAGLGSFLVYLVRGRGRGPRGPGATPTEPPPG